MPEISPLKFQAESFQACIDYPFELGIFECIEFTANNISHQIILSGNYYEFDKARLKQDIQKICETEIDFFQNAPFSSYIFLLHMQHNSYGGLEHRNSSSLTIAKECLPK
ncbi:hypothetical protein GKC56_05820 [Neisseriaceae bacterium PsAf]|nr:hypothetical protein [Neisseriaceae bacterium PsAf]